MQIALHAGLHATDEDRLLRSLIRNREFLDTRGVIVPRAGLYRKRLRVFLRQAVDGAMPSAARDEIMGAIAPQRRPERMVLSVPGALGAPGELAGGEAFYALADIRLSQICEIFDGDRLELFLAIRNPATFLPAALELTREKSMAEFLGNADPMALRWSELVHRLRRACPNVPITLWCNEDTPLIWSEIMREMAGLDPTERLEGEFALLEEIMTGPGLQRFESYMADRPDMSEIQKRRVVAAFLEKFADEAAIEQELDVPGWTDAYVEQMTDLYDEDVDVIRRIPGVNMIMP